MRHAAKNSRYAFDVIGELYFGRMFGFMESGGDHGSWIESLDLLMPFLCMTAVAPSYVRPLILASAVVVPGSLKALKAIDNIGVAARSCVAKRFDEAPKSEGQSRTDILEQLYRIHLEKGDKVDFQLGDIQQEAYVALLVCHQVETLTCADPSGSRAPTRLPSHFARCCTI
jgi:hypothetical protein